MWVVGCGCFWDFSVSLCPESLVSSLESRQRPDLDQELDNFVLPIVSPCIETKFLEKPKGSLILDKILDHEGWHSMISLGLEKTRIHHSLSLPGVCSDTEMCGIDP